MLSPLMHILSCLDEKFEVGAPVNIFELSKKDKDLIVSEARRICSYFKSEDKIWITESPTGLKMVSDVQVISGEAVKINPYTALLLTRVWSCVDTYLKEVCDVITELKDDDLSNDSVVLRLEGNPNYVYAFVYNTMETKALTYDARIEKIKELLMIIKSHIVVQDSTSMDLRLRAKLELHSKLNYWSAMLTSDYVKYYGSIPSVFCEKDLEIVKRELRDLGVYGFNNPLKMYIEFSNSRVSRKVEVNIEDWVVDFLTKVVLSGGAMLDA